VCYYNHRTAHHILSVAPVHNSLYNLISLSAVVCTVTCEVVTVDTKGGDTLSSRHVSSCDVRIVCPRPKGITVVRNVTRYILVHLYHRLFREARVTIIFVRVNYHSFTLKMVFKCDYFIRKLKGLLKSLRCV
jgi:hypothetical protein